jgi:Ca2+-binding EF-hand superfamily protein
MKNKLMIGAGLVALLAIPVLAQGGGESHAGMHKMHEMGPTTRAELEAKIKERFAEADANKDGAVTKAEFDARIAAKRQEWQAKRAERRAEMFARLDTDKNGQLSQQEFATRPEGERGGWKGRGKGHHGGMMGMGRGGEGWFERMDANKDGKVTLAEATAMPLAMFDKADTNKDGTLSPEERKAAHEKMRQEWKAKRG